MHPVLPIESALPALRFLAGRQLLEGMGITTPAMALTVSNGALAKGLEELGQASPEAKEGEEPLRVYEPTAQ